MIRQSPSIHRPTHRRAAMLTLLGLVLPLPLAGPAHAQSIADADERRMGLTVSARGYYDSNVLRGQNLEVSRPDANRSDVIAEPRVTADIVSPFGRQSIFVTGSAGYRFHAHNDFLNRETINATAGVRLRPIRPCMATIAGTYVRQQSELFNIFDTLDPKNTETIATGAADLACVTPGGLSSTLGYRRTSATNSSTVRQINEYNSNSYTGSLGYSRPRLGIVSLYASYATTRYPNRQLIAAGPQADGVQIYSGGVRYERKIGTRLTGEVSAGYTQVDPRLPGVRDFKGANWAADLTYDSRNRVRAYLSAARSVEQSNLIGDAYGITTAFRLSADYGLSDRFKLTAGAAYVRRRFEQSPLYQLPNFNSRDRTVSVYARLAAGNVGPVAIVFDAAREHRKAAVRLYNYGSTRVGVTATYRFGR